MNIQELKSYLKSALDLESAVLSCEQAVCLLDKRITADSPFPGVPDPVFPREPLRSDKCYHTPLPPAPIYPVKERIYYQEPQKATGFKRVVEYIVDDLISDFRYSAIKQRIANKQYKKRVVAAELDFNNRVKRYYEETEKYRNTIAPIIQKDEQAFERAKAQWTKTCNLIKENHNLYLREAKDAWRQADESKKEALRTERYNLLQKRDKLKHKLSKLYHHGPLYPKFQNMIAVAQLYDYIASGISNELEGPNGAYSQYMQDVRAERIRESLDTLRTEITARLDEVIKMQYTMCNLLVEANEQLVILESGISNVNYELNDIRQEIVSSKNYLNDMSSKLASLHEVSVAISNNTAHLSQNTHDIASSVGSIGRTTEAIAFDTAMISFNQYINMKSRGANAFLFS